MPILDGTGPANNNFCARRGLGRGMGTGTGIGRKLGRGYGICQDVDNEYLKNVSKADMIESLKNRIAKLEGETTKGDE
ncbi:MAG: hypothetical protein ACLKAO_11660 [Alkaliphilus sp.]